MNPYTAQIKVTNPHDLEKLFHAEEKNFQNNRAQYTLSLTPKEAVFHIEAQDATALRAALNSIAKVLSVHEKTRNVLKDERAKRSWNWQQH